MSLMASLGLENVEADPNFLADGKYAGEVFKSEYVYSKPKNKLWHVITYRVVDGDRKGAQKQEFFEIGSDPVYDPESGALTSVTFTMTEAQKPWYKKRHMDLGIPEAQVHLAKPEDLIGKKVTFGVKKNGEFVNINFVELREGTDTPEPTDTNGILGNL